MSSTNSEKDSSGTPPAVTPPGSVDVIIKDFSISIVNKKDASKNKKILHPISTVINGGTLFAILGGSGSGKTTLLNVIAGRYTAKQLAVGGVINFGILKKCSIGYVTQQDFLLPHLTVKETILFAARMKVDPATPIPSHKHNKESSTDTDICSHLTDEVIQDLGLKECANSLVGDNSGTSQLSGGPRGLSGGERRRVSIAIQIISDCKVLCADEPTSGLDSFTAITVVEALHRLTRGAHHTTVISSIHQPRADVFHMFDGVLLLSKGGHAIYCGTTKAMVRYFKQLGFDCPRNSNPADYFVDLSSVDTRSAKDLDESKTRVSNLIEAFMVAQQHDIEQPAPLTTILTHQEDTATGIIEPLHKDAVAYMPSWSMQAIYLMGRFLKNNFRDLSNTIGSAFQALALGLILMGIFWQLNDSLTDIQSRNGLFYITVSMEAYILMIILVERYCTELKVFDRELQDDLYAPTAYITAHILSSAPLFLLQGVLYSVPVYYGCNLRDGGQHTIVFIALNTMVIFVINGIAWMCVSASRDFTVASLLANMNFTFISLTAGFLVNYNDIPIYVKWVRYLSFCSYGYRILMSNEYSDRTLPGCPSPNPADCIQYDGNYILTSQGIEVNDFQITWIALAVLCTGYHGIAYLLLHFVHHPVTGIVGSDISVDEEVDEHDQVPAVEQNDGERADGTVPTHDEDFTRTPVSITVNGVYLTVRTAQQNTIALSDTADGAAAVKSKNKAILSDISASIQPGRLVALMGGSGSGKTTLLNLIAGRISPRCLRPEEKGFNAKKILSSVGLGGSSQYEGCGEVLFNNTVPSGAKLRDLIGYVQQFDFHLPSLTVKETLLFHANLRLPQGTDPLKRQQRVQQVLSTLDLHQCAHTRVGDAELKGISGGEKRRLSLGVQLLADPAVCLLDEPTTGLDAFTARHVVQTLQQLAHKGRTVVVSIHQPRYDVFALLDDVILLARGRLVWAGSSADMLKHFAALGHPCPPLTNPADFILDISSVDFRSEEKEVASKARLQDLLKGRTEHSKRSQSPIPHIYGAEDQVVPSYTQSSSGHVEMVGAEKINNDSRGAELVAAVTVAENDNTAVITIKPLYFTLPLLLHRSLLNISRQPPIALNRISQGTFYALILACFYAPLKQNQNSIQDRVGILYELTALCFIGMLSCIAIFPSERNVFYREYVDGDYSALAFFLAYFIIAIPFLVVTSVIIASLVTFAVGVQPTGLALAIFTGVVFCFIFVGECIGVIFCSIFMHIGFSVNIISVVISIFCVMAGFMSLQMPLGLRYISYISPTTWGAYIITNVAFQQETFSCSANERNTLGQCPISTGEELLDLYGMSGGGGPYGMLWHMIWLIVVTVGYILAAFMVVRGRAYKLSH